MLKKTGLLSLGLFLGFNALAQTFYKSKSTFYSMYTQSTVDENNTWYVKDDLTYNNTSGDTTYYQLGREVVLKKQNDNLNIRQVTIFEENNRVYVRGLIGSIDYFGGVMLFDFNLTQGDTFSFLDPTFPRGKINRYVIDSVGFKLFADNKLRNTQYISPLFEYDGPPVFVSEDIGPSNGLLGFIDEMLLLRLNKGHSKLVSACFEDDIRYSNPAYENLDIESCDVDTFKNRIIADVMDVGKMDVKIYPNPTRGVVNLKDLKYDELYIVSMQGQIVNKIITVQTQISVADLPKGVYFIKTVYKSKWTTYKLVKK